MFSKYQYINIQFRKTQKVQAKIEAVADVKRLPEEDITMLEAYVTLSNNVYLKNNTHKKIELKSQMHNN